MAEPRVTRTVVNPNGITPALQRAARRASASMRSDTVDLGGGLTRTLRRVERLTDENYHGEALRTVSNHFHYDDLTEEFVNINRAHFQARGLTQELYERRMRAMNDLFSRIRRDYGDQVYNRVHRAL